MKNLKKWDTNLSNIRKYLCMTTAWKFIRDLFISHKRGPFGPEQKEIHILISGEKNNQTNAKRLEEQMECSIGIIISTLWREIPQKQTFLLVRCEMI